MFGADIAIMIMYVLGFACTGMIAFLVFIPAMVMSVYLGWVLVDSFPAEYLYYLAQSMAWLFPGHCAAQKYKDGALRADDEPLRMAGCDRVIRMGIYHACRNAASCAVRIYYYRHPSVHPFHHF